MHARVIFSLGATKPGPPRTCRGTMANTPATTPPVSMNLRRERGRRGDGLLLAFVIPKSSPFISNVISIRTYLRTTTASKSPVHSPAHLLTYGHAPPTVRLYLCTND